MYCYRLQIKWVIKNKYIYETTKSSGSTVDTATGYGLGIWGEGGGELSLGEVKNYHFSVSSKSLWAHKASHPMGVGGSFPGGNTAGA
jgi:hypothetical protein